MASSFMVGTGGEIPTCIGCMGTVLDKNGTGVTFTHKTDLGLCNNCLHDLTWLGAAVCRLHVTR